MSEQSEKLAIIKKAISKAALISGRKLPDIDMIAVSKTHSVEIIRPILELGHRSFGENRVQEAQMKWPALKNEFSHIELNLIGPLQSNKAAEAVTLFDVIHTVDREKIAKILASEMQKQEKQLKLFVQVNTGCEPQKAGIEPQKAVAFVKQCQEVYGLQIEGMMCIPPANENPGPHFALLRKLAGEAGLTKLSMGMSSDFETAIELGATHVRVGSALFGDRGAGTAAAH